MNRYKAKVRSIKTVCVDYAGDLRDVQIERAYVYREQVAVHRAWRSYKQHEKDVGWVVTHLSTGMRIFPECKTKAGADCFAWKLLDCVDVFDGFWDMTRETSAKYLRNNPRIVEVVGHIVGGDV